MLNYLYGDCVMGRVRNFTLIELLVVVSIIGILSSMLLPSLQKARKKTKEAVCLNNQKQLYLGASIYSSDSSDLLPNGGIQDSWDARNSGVIGTFGLLGMEDTPLSFHCPLGQTLDTVGQGHNMDIQHPWGAGMSWYNDNSVSRIIVGFNERVTQWKNFYGTDLRFTDDANTILFHDVVDKRVGIKWHHLDNYNVVKLDGSGKKIFDKGMVVDGMVPGSFDGHGNPPQEQATYEYMESL